MCIATFVNWSENSKLSQHLQFTCCSVSPGTGKPSWSVHFDSIHKENLRNIDNVTSVDVYSLSSGRYSWILQLSVCAGSEILSSNNRIHFHILNSNFQNLINKTTVCVN